MLFLLRLLGFYGYCSRYRGIGEILKIARRRRRLVERGSYGGREDEVVEVHGIQRGGIRGSFVELRNSRSGELGITRRIGLFSRNY